MQSGQKEEHARLWEDASRDRNWKRWGRYLADCQWGTVREDYSAAGEVWTNFVHEHARSRAYRWGEDGCPKGSGNKVILQDAVRKIARRLARLFTANADGERPVHGGEARYARDPHCRDRVLFLRVLSRRERQESRAGHQTGWIVLITRLLTCHDE